MTTGTWDVAFREAGHRIGVRIVHLAEREEGFERALCGRKRVDEPLEPNAQGEVCLVCADMYWHKHGREWGEQ